MPKPDFVVDTVSLCNFLLADAVDALVRSYPGRLVITPQVYDEIITGMAKHPPLNRLTVILKKRQVGLISLTDKELIHYAALVSRLGRGEASCVALASARNWIVVSDDRDARNHCAESGIRVTGTIGILKAACIGGQVNAQEADLVLEKMIAAGFYSPVRRISDLLHR